ncbi:Orf35 [Heliothis zea nudivirus]|uniref:Orf35 n=1 Tax=Heliothis zea nudivirus 1 TaxID=3116536 RepID=Q8JKS6_9VIRU|nr:Orf35 [Heliothis zea nudivirus]AAN04330.1 Orf35 [Heliothis zea nudivirus]
MLMLRFNNTCYLHLLLCRLKLHLILDCIHSLTFYTGNCSSFLNTCNTHFYKLLLQKI